MEIEHRLDQSKALEEQFTFENIVYAACARELAAAHTAQSQERAKERYDSRRREVEYAPGDKVWIRRQRRIVGQTEKLLPAYLGPFVVLCRTAPNDYMVQDADGNTDVVNVERFKPCLTRQEPEGPVGVTSSISDEELPTEPLSVSDQPPEQSRVLIDWLNLYPPADVSMSLPDESDVTVEECDEDECVMSEPGLDETFMSLSPPPSPEHVPEPEPDSLITRSGRVSRPPGWILRCAPTTL